MDTLQLNKINELAREYLRLGIAKGSSDAVEKARFQLAFEAQRAEPEQSPYEALFDQRGNRRPQRDAREQNNAQTHERSEPSPLDIRTDRMKEIAAKLEEIQGAYERAFRHQQSRIAQLEEGMKGMRSELTHLKNRPQSVAPPQTNQAPSHEPEGPIATTIEQTIKGRTITSDDVAVDKIFYFGNR